MSKRLSELRRRKRKRERRRNRKKVVPFKNKYELAAKLNREMPASEVWFWGEWERAGMKHVLDTPNEVFLGFIPDVVNHHYKYIVEIDGGVHLRPSVMKRDEHKEKVFKNRGYEVFRLEAYNDELFGILVDNIAEIRDRKDFPKVKTVLRKAIG